MVSREVVAAEGRANDEGESWGGKSGRVEAPAVYHDEITTHLTQPTSGSILEGDTPADTSLFPSTTPVTTMSTSLDLLKQTGTVVVSDSGDFECEYRAVA